MRITTDPPATVCGRRIIVIDAITRQIGRMRQTRGRRCGRLWTDLYIHYSAHTARYCLPLNALSPWRYFEIFWHFGILTNFFCYCKHHRCIDLNRFGQCKYKGKDDQVWLLKVCFLFTLCSNECHIFWIPLNDYRSSFKGLVTLCRKATAECHSEKSNSKEKPKCRNDKCDYCS